MKRARLIAAVFDYSRQVAEVSMPVQERLRDEIDEALEQFRAVMVEG